MVICHVAHVSYREKKQNKINSNGKVFIQKTLSHMFLFLIGYKNLSVILLCVCVLSFWTCCSSAAYYVWGDMLLCVKWWVSGNMQEGGDCRMWVERLLDDFWQITSFFYQLVICHQSYAVMIFSVQYEWTMKVYVIFLSPSKAVSLNCNVLLSTKEM